MQCSDDGLAKVLVVADAGVDARIQHVGKVHDGQTPQGKPLSYSTPTGRASSDLENHEHQAVSWKKKKGCMDSYRVVLRLPMRCGYFRRWNTVGINRSGI